MGRKSRLMSIMTYCSRLRGSSTTAGRKRWSLPRCWLMRWCEHKPVPYLRGHVRRETMKTNLLGIFLSLISIAGLAQQQSVRGDAVGGRVTTAGPGGHGVVVYRREMGKWWQNSEVAKKLQLSDSQIAQLDQIFYDHKMKLIDYGAEMEKQ